MRIMLVWPAMSEGDYLKAWIEDIGVKLLLKLGLRRGFKVLDFGCGSGNYAIPAALIVGDEGLVYAIDSEECSYWPGACLSELRLRVKRYGLSNVIILRINESSRLPLSTSSINAALLFDVLHSYYFPGKGSRVKVLREVYRVMICDNYLLFYPGDPEISGWFEEVRELINEIEHAGFRLIATYEGYLIHENTLVKGHIYKFIKIC